MAFKPAAFTSTTGAQIRPAFDASNYADFTVGSGGDLTIAPTGGNTAITGALAISTTLAVTGLITAAAGISVAGGQTYTTAAANDLNLVAPTGRSAFIKIAGSTYFTMANDGAITLANTLAVTGTSALTGNVGIGVAAQASVALHVKGTVSGNQAATVEHTHATVPRGEDLFFSGGAPNDTTAWFMRMRDTVGDKVFVYSDGSFQGLANSYGGISDRRIKNNFTPATDQREDVKALALIASNFAWNRDPKNKRHLGWIAQDVMKVSPGLITEHEHEELGTVYGMRTSVAHTKAAIALGQHLTYFDNEWEPWGADVSSRIETNEQKITNLTEQVADLERRLAA